MKFTALTVQGAWRIDVERHHDARGSFGRIFCREEFGGRGLVNDLVQMSLSHNLRAGTLRGMHYQQAPHGETKLVRVTRGAVHDVLLDLRMQSSSYLRWDALELSAENGCAVYIPPGVAHGFLTRDDDTEVLYAMDTPFQPDAARGVRWNDAAFGIVWPLQGAPVVSERDSHYPDWTGPDR